MKKTLITVALLAFISPILAQTGSVRFDTHIPGIVIAHVFGPESPNDCTAIWGNTSTDFPVGVTTYKGQLLSGVDYIASLWAAPGCMNNESSFVEIAQTTFRQSTGSLSGYIIGGTVVLPFAVNPGDPVTFQVRVWVSNGGIIPSWANAVATGVPHGKSQLVCSVPGTGGFYYLQGLTSFNIHPAIPPAITDNPFTQSVTAGDVVTFAVSASGNVPMSYQWYFNNSPISGETSSSLVISNATMATAGNYKVLVNNCVASAMSYVASLWVNSIQKNNGITVYGPQGSNCVVQYATSLDTVPIPWTTLTNITITTEPSVILDYSPTETKRFYRTLPGDSASKAAVVKATDQDSRNYRLLGGSTRKPGKTTYFGRNKAIREKISKTSRP